MESHFEPKPNVIAERYKFHKRSQLPQETIADFVAELRRLAIHCEFGNVLDDTLRDRLVVGIRSAATQKKLLSKKTLTFQEACETARTMEAADQTAKALHHGEGSDSSGGINNLRKKFHPKQPPHPHQPKQPKQQPDSSPSKLCYRCGRTNHTPLIAILSKLLAKSVGRRDTSPQSAGQQPKPQPKVMDQHARSSDKQIL